MQYLFYKFLEVPHLIVANSHIPQVSSLHSNNIQPDGKRGSGSECEMLTREVGEPDKQVHGQSVIYELFRESQRAAGEPAHEVPDVQVGALDGGG